MVDERGGAIQIPMQIHPRVFAALGQDLVTNDTVAVVELVKNAYDALASRVTVSLTGIPGEQQLLIEDDGHGMTLDVIRDAWCVVATPYRVEHELEVDGELVRRVSGSKGLGRLSSARLGASLEVATQAPSGECLRVQVDWDALALADDLTTCAARVDMMQQSPFPKGHGTRLTVSRLRTTWGAAEWDVLRENLSRLASPFDSAPSTFSVYMDAGDGERESRVVTPEFLSHPYYSLRGSVDRTGRITANYRCDHPGWPERQVELSHSWEMVVAQSKGRPWELPDTPTAACGAFDFEFRVWDVAPEDRDEIADRFGIGKNQIRRAIRYHKGVSVYRDGILVIPKSETARDWLGLDLRRVSDVGKRISTSQLVGQVRIGAEANPGISDTSDRERLVESTEVKEFMALLVSAVALLENERARDRDEFKRKDVRSTNALLGSINGQALVFELEQAVNKGATAEEALTIAGEFSAELDRARDEIERRFVYYSRLATIGTIAEILIHEIRNRTAILGGLVRRLRPAAASVPETVLGASERAIASLDRLADTFAPLANRAYKRGRRSADLGAELDATFTLLEKDIRDAGAEIEIVGRRDVSVQVDPGELGAVLVNVLLNALYWVKQSPRGSRMVRLSTKQKEGRVTVSVADSGPGVEPDDIEQIMLPGVTKKPDGIGMGLTVVGEIIDSHGGALAVESPGPLGGADFSFDLPLSKTKATR